MNRTANMKKKVVLVLSGLILIYVILSISVPMQSIKYSESLSRASFMLFSSNRTEDLEISSGNFISKNISHLSSISNILAEEFYTKKTYTQFIEDSKVNNLSENTIKASSILLQESSTSESNSLCVKDIPSCRNYSHIELEPVRGEKHIMFLETGCVLNSSANSKENGFSLSRRQACAVESAARTNPDSKIYILYTCPIIGKIDDSPDYVKVALFYQNVNIWKIDFPKYFGNTPLRNWDYMGKIKTSYWPLSHASDILRYITLWKYGGTYLDLDFVIQRSLDDLGPNFAGEESPKHIESGAMNLGADLTGRTIATLCVRDIHNNFNGHVWGRNGPGVITRVLKKICSTERIEEMTRDKCAGFQVVPQNVFYAIHYTHWKEIFRQNVEKGLMEKIKASYGVHVWNKFSSSTEVKVGSGQLYATLANKYCPRVYSNCGLVL